MKVFHAPIVDVKCFHFHRINNYFLPQKKEKERMPGKKKEKERMPGKEERGEMGKEERGEKGFILIRKNLKI